MPALLGLLGFILLLVVLWDAFEAILLPRRVTRKLRVTRMFYRTTWHVWSAIPRRIQRSKVREAYLSYYGPLSMILLLGTWALGLVMAFALFYAALGSPLQAPAGIDGFAEDLYFSGTTFFTLGLGDITPTSPSARVVTTVEAGMGFGFLALVIGYLPVLYQSFSRREWQISMLDARAGSPATATELIRRFGSAQSLSTLPVMLQEWERWAAEVLESHVSYPVLGYFRSQHDNQSWLGALTLILDTSALVVAGVIEAPLWQARLAFAMSRHAAVDLAQIFNAPPKLPDPERLSASDMERMRTLLAQSRVPVNTSPEVQQKLERLRRMYEPYVNSLAGYLLVQLPSWFRERETKDNWQTSAWERQLPSDEHF